jgi:hypothetical protein
VLSAVMIITDDGRLALGLGSKPPLPALAARRND